MDGNGQQVGMARVFLASGIAEGPLSREGAESSCFPTLLEQKGSLRMENNDVCR